MSRFSDKVAIITGGASGIGKKTAEMFVEQGGKVLIGDIDEDAGKVVSLEIAEKFGKDSVGYIYLDVSNPEHCKSAVDFAISEFGSINCLLNSAIKMAPGMLKDLSLKDLLVSTNGPP